MKILNYFSIFEKNLVKQLFILNNRNQYICHENT